MSDEEVIDYQALVDELRSTAARWEERGVPSVLNLDSRSADAIEALIAENSDCFARIRELRNEWLDAGEERERLRAERDALRAQLDRVRKYADDREHYGRRNRTVGSARIASDLFAILDADADRTLAELAERQTRPNGLEGVL